jgi:peptidoglycan hydrolase-like protein with peptidoglycan-binding domain
LAGAIVLAALLIPTASGMAATNSSTTQGSGGAGLGGSSTSQTKKTTTSKKKKKKKTAKPRSSKKTTDALPGDSNHLGDRVLRPGMSGHDVRVLQDYLTIAGYPTSIDGEYGPATKTNVLAFQRSAGFTANAVVTVPVEKALRAAVAKADAAPATGTTRINSDGTATAPAGAPTAVQQAIAAANQIIDTSYCYGGGHGSFRSSCYDCSGAVSFALHGGGLLSSPEDSVDLESYGSPGPGKWITVYADSSHAFVVIGGRAFDTADYGGPNVPSGSGPRWRSNPTGNLADGGNYIVRHPTGY